MKVQEIADRIDAYLRRFEKDPKINKADEKYGTSPYYCARACRGGNRVFVKYVRYQVDHSLPKWKAEKYLAWLDAGNVGTHHEALR